MEGFQLILHQKYLNSIIWKKYSAPKKTTKINVQKWKTDENFNKYFLKKDVEEKLNMSHGMSISLNEHE